MSLGLRALRQARSTLRDTHATPTWMIDPAGYAILSVCGPHEVGLELNFNGHTRVERFHSVHFVLSSHTLVLRSQRNSYITIYG